MEAVVTSRDVRIACRVAQTFWSRMRGLMFSAPLRPKHGLLMDFQARCNVGIHMMSVFFPLCLVWLDSGGKVVAVDKHARPFLFVSRRHYCRYVLEVRPEDGAYFRVGQRLTIKLLKKDIY